MTVTASPKCSLRWRVSVVLPEPVPPAMPMKMVLIGVISSPVVRLSVSIIKSAAANCKGDRPPTKKIPRKKGRTVDGGAKRKYYVNKFFARAPCVRVFGRIMYGPHQMPRLRRKVFLKLSPLSLLRRGGSSAQGVRQAQRRASRRGTKAHALRPRTAHRGAAGGAGRLFLVSLRRQIHGKNSGGPRERCGERRPRAGRPDARRSRAGRPDAR